MITISFHIKLEGSSHPQLGRIPIMNWPGSVCAGSVDEALDEVAKIVKELSPKANKALDDYLNGKR